MRKSHAALGWEHACAEGAWRAGLLFNCQGSTQEKNVFVGTAGNLTTGISWVYRLHRRLRLLLRTLWTSKPTGRVCLTLRRTVRENEQGAQLHHLLFQKPSTWAGETDGESSLPRRCEDLVLILRTLSNYTW